MRIELCPITAETLDMLEKMEAQHGEDLAQYQSRLRPYRWQEQLGTPNLLWYYIYVEEQPLGCIWLERIPGEAPARLGIFLADPAHRGTGVGTAAIQQLLTPPNPLNRQVLLHVREENQRAIHCYERCGFQLTEKTKRTDGLTVCTMVFTAPI